MYTVVRAPTGIVGTLSSIYTVVRAPTGIVSTLSSIYTTLGGSNRNSEYTKFNLHNKSIQIVGILHLSKNGNTIFRVGPKY
jgi:hypothetical protein